MSRVFVSYSRSNEDAAAAVAKAIEAQGYEVWRDDQLPAHRAYSEVIEERLREASAVVVLWSEEATKSQWVRAEADAARSAGTLVQARLDDTIPPLPFNQYQCADLLDWHAKADSPGWRKLAASVAALAGEPDSPALGDRAAPERRTPSICVLPFANMSCDPEQDYFSDGISEDITTDLSKVSALEVVARNTAFQFKGQSVDVGEIARKLGVTHVLEGSVRKSGNKVRISAQLIGLAGSHVWAERYDRDLTDIFAIQDEITKEIVAALKLRLLPDEKTAIERRGTTSVEAYNFYLMARDSWTSGNHGDRHREERVIRLCGRAVEIDPHYSQAWTLIAIAQSSLRYGFGIPGDDGVAAAQKALEADPTMVEAHCPLARGLIEQGKYDEAREVIARALTVNPDSWEAHYEGSRLYNRQRKFKQAAAHLERCVSIAESDFYSAGMLVSFYHALGDSVAEQRAASLALKLAESAVSHDPNNGSALSVGARALASLGDYPRAREWMERGLLLDPDNLNMRYNLASVHAAFFQDYETAFDLLAQTMAKASGHLIRWAQEIDPDVDSIRQDPRFERILSEAKYRLANR